MGDTRGDFQVVTETEDAAASKYTYLPTYLGTFLTKGDTSFSPTNSLSLLNPDVVFSPHELSHRLHNLSHSIF